MKRITLHCTTDGMCRFPFPKMSETVYVFTPKTLDAMVEGEEIISPSFDLSQQEIDLAVESVYRQLETDGCSIGRVVITKTPTGTSILGYGNSAKRDSDTIELDLDLDTPYRIQRRLMND